VYATYVSHLKKINTLVLVLIILVNLSTLLLPLEPAVSFWFRKRSPQATQKLQTQVNNAATDTTNPPVPDGNSIIIPSMLLNQPIIEGTSPYTVNKGVWRFPSSSTPDKGGNTVLIGHRFTYHNAAVFYHLDLLLPGQTLAVYWNHKAYRYKVTAADVVAPSDTAIENPTADARLTIFTCTPLWTSKSRLVVTAELIKEPS
jgi:sortase A